jgi:hypothetical protein
MKIELNPLAIFYNGLLWTVTYRKSHNQLSDQQKQLSDEFVRRLKRSDKKSVLQK